MIYQSMGNDSREADEVYIKRGCSVLEDFVFFSLYLIPGIAKRIQH